MRTVVQRVVEAWVDVDGTRISAIGRGLLALVGIEEGDGEAERHWMAQKLAMLRIFEDDAGRMNRSLLDPAIHNAALLLVPNFTVAGDTRKGMRPSFDRAMRPEAAEAMFDDLAERTRALGVRVETGLFRAHMHVGLINDGPVTIILQTPLRPS